MWAERGHLCGQSQAYWEPWSRWGKRTGERLEAPASATPRRLCPTVKHQPPEPSRFISAPTKTPDKMGFDEVGGSSGSGHSRLQVFMINLRRRQDRRERMLRSLQEQGIECRLVEAVDGK
ncbi:Procollagen galactosyltransferase 1 [Saguinus oedipus]|uniref:Procollagen galactosyltransferase 1 n=1 Tax=Saguinus oedipus TaxID=9490 RepID=A0ABQ9TSA1_SAGOE|nr:Procollagen galactosyltransferase 1 [Saguinus oedipus]